jgi:hypothetical protein
MNTSRLRSRTSIGFRPSPELLTENGDPFDQEIADADMIAAGMYFLANVALFVN